MGVSLSDMILPHVDNPSLHEKLAALYAQLDSEIAAHAPVCVNRGVCCRFDEFGHDLFVTTTELAYFAAIQRADVWRIPHDGGCPYQIEGKCTARTNRPLGCRVFFCDPDAQHWQPETYERYLRAIQKIGDECGVAYHYVEWMKALREITPI